MLFVDYLYYVAILQFVLLLISIIRFFKEIMPQSFGYPSIIFGFLCARAIYKLLIEHIEYNNKFDDMKTIWINLINLTIQDNKKLKFERIFWKE